MLDDVLKRLESLGYTASLATDKWAIDFAVSKVTKEIKNSCNIQEIPDGLYEVFIDMVCGEFFMTKKNSGQLDGFEVDINAMGLKQIQEGDTSLTYAIEGTKSAEQRLDALIDFLLSHGKDQFVTYRRLKW